MSWQFWLTCIALSLFVLAIIWAWIYPDKPPKSLPKDYFRYSDRGRLRLYVNGHEVNSHRITPMLPFAQRDQKERK